MSRISVVLCCLLAVTITFAGDAEAHKGKCHDVKCPKPSNPCRVAKCNPNTGKCYTEKRRNGYKCNDKNKCTINSTCQNGQCVGVAKVCKQPVNNVCAERVCNLFTGLCVLAPKPNTEGVACDDGRACTVGDKCLAGKCVGTPKVCDGSALGPCKSVKCVEPTGVCTATNKTDGTHCGDGNRCTLRNVCMGGVCSVGTPKNCISTQCIKRTCNPLTGLCDSTPLDGVACDDGKKCTTNDKCVNGVCRGTPVVCPANAATPCKVTKCNETTGKCDKVRNAPDNTLCSDSNKCTIGDKCKRGKCVGRPLCRPDDKTKCITESCDPAVGSCVSSLRPDGTSCSASGKKCLKGSCQFTL